jgi:hypothetical protein
MTTQPAATPHVPDAAAEALPTSTAAGGPFLVAAMGFAAFLMPAGLFKRCERESLHAGLASWR